MTRLQLHHAAEQRTRPPQMHCQPRYFQLQIITFIIITQAKTYIYLKSTQTGENKNQPTKPQMTSTTSITRLKTPILYQNSRLF